MPTTHPKRILILIADAGYGHRSAAKAVAAALKEQYGEDCITSIENPLDSERAPAPLRSSQEDYDRVVRNMPNLYQLGYQISDAPLSSAVIERAFTVMLYEAVRETVERCQPDAIVAVHPYYAAPLTALSAIRKLHIPLITVVTDLATVHRIWFNNEADYCLVPTQAVYDLALENDLPAEKVRMVGIPVNPAIANEQRAPADIRAELGWNRDLKTVLAIGSKRVVHLLELLNVLNHSGLPLQLVVVAGGNDDLYSALQRIEWHRPTHLYNFVDNLPTMMRAADMVLAKPGGLTTTESLAAGLPMLLFDPIPGQETGNVDYVVVGGAGDLITGPVHLLETAFHWLDKDGALLAERAANARKLGKPRAAYDVAELAWTLAERGPQPRQESNLQTLTDLLARFGIVTS
jgi:1,2-diacylglycerol 3-beta-galactosyltransferase